MRYMRSREPETIMRTQVILEHLYLTCALRQDHRIRAVALRSCDTSSSLSHKQGAAWRGVCFSCHPTLASRYLSRPRCPTVVPVANPGRRVPDYVNRTRLLSAARVSDDPILA